MADETREMTADGREDFLADPDFQDAYREVVAGLRRLAEESGVEEVMVFSAIAGGTGSSGVSLPGVPSPRRDDEFAEPLATWLLRHEDRRYGLAVDEDCNPLSGQKLFGGDPDDEFSSGDDDDE